jgi:hypothetical protein
MVGSCGIHADEFQVVCWNSKYESLLSGTDTRLLHLIPRIDVALQHRLSVRVQIRVIDMTAQSSKLEFISLTWTDPKQNKKNRERGIVLCIWLKGDCIFKTPLYI